MDVRFFWHVRCLMRRIRGGVLRGRCLGAPAPSVGAGHGASRKAALREPVPRNDERWQKRRQQGGKDGLGGIDY